MKKIFLTHRIKISGTSIVFKLDYFAKISLTSCNTITPVHISDRGNVHIVDFE